MVDWVDNKDEDQFMRYDCVLRYADKDTGTFHNFKLPANPIPPPGDKAIHDNASFVTNKLNWTEINISRYKQSWSTGRTRILPNAHYFLRTNFYLA